MAMDSRLHKARRSAMMDVAATTNFNCEGNLLHFLWESDSKNQDQLELNMDQLSVLQEEQINKIQTM